MFHVNQELYRIIEDIQRKAIISLGANPEEIAIRNAKKNKTDFLEKENWEEHYAEMTIKDFYMMMPEHPYDTSLEYFKYTRLCRVTKFDQPGFLRRFANITSLCHEFYTQANRRPNQEMVFADRLSSSLDTKASVREDCDSQHDEELSQARPIDAALKFMS